VNDKTIDDISDIRDESDRDGMRIVIELKRGAEPQIVLNQLFKHTSMQEGFSMILLAVVNSQPKEMGLIQAIKHFIDHRVDVVRRRTSYLLNKARDREHILVGYKIALDNIDEVIRLIRASANRQEAKEALLAAKLRVMDAGWAKILRETGSLTRAGVLTPIQADAILELQLHRLTKLSQDEIINELEAIRKQIVAYEEILNSEKKLRKVIVDELEQVKKLYGDARRTVIEDEAAEIMLEDLIADEQVAVTVSHSGYMKRTPISTYRMQRRGGTGRTGMKTRDEDFVEHLFIASTHAYILIFTNTGRVYWLKVYEIPDIAAAGKGKHVGNLVGLQPGETVRTMLAVRDLEEEHRYVFFATHNGTVKKSAVKDFSHVMQRGIIAINIEEGDELVAASLTDGNQIVFLASHDGQAVRFDENDVRSMGRNATGVRGMNLAEKDYIVGMATTLKPEAKAAVKEGEVAPEIADLIPEKGSLILSVTENGYGKRTPADEYRLTNRGGKGVINVKTTARNGKVVGISQVSEKSEVMLISQYGKIIRIESKFIRESGRSAQGVRLLNVEPGDRVAAAVVIPPEEPNGNGTLIQ
jgi:DNA gyrase subunit A